MDVVILVLLFLFVTQTYSNPAEMNRIWENFELEYYTKIGKLNVEFKPHVMSQLIPTF